MQGRRRPVSDITKSIKFVLLGEDRGAVGALKKVGTGFRQSAKDAHGFAGKAKFAAGAIGGLAIGAAVAGAAIAVKFGKDSIDTFKRVGGETRTLARITGMSAEQASRMGFAMKESGVDAKTGAKSFTILSKNLASSADGGKKAAAMAKLLGINFTDAHGKVKPMADLMPQLADKFSKMPDGAEKSALAMKLFGKSGVAMLPFLNRGAKGLKELAKESDRTGNTLSGKQLDALKANKAEQKKFDAAMQGLSITLGSMLLPIMTQGAQFMNSVLLPAIAGATKFVQDNQGAFDGLGNMMRWFWNSVLLPVMKFWISANADTVAGIGIIIEATGRLTGNKDMEAFGKGIQNAANQTKAWANSLQGIPDKVAPVVETKDKSTKVIAAINAKMKTLKNKLVTAKAKGDTKEVDRLKGKIAALKGKKVNIEAHVKKTGVTTIALKKGSAHGLQVVGYRVGGRPRVGEIAQFHKDEFWVPDRVGTVISQARSRAMMGSGPVATGGGRGGTNINLNVQAAPGQQPREVWVAVRDGLLSLKPTLGPKGLAFG